MSRIAFVSEDETVFPAVYRVASEGHKVTWWVHDPDRATQKVGRGLVARVPELVDVINARPDVCVGYQTPDACADLAKAGIPTWGCSAASVDMEEDRIEGIKLAERYGCGAALETHRFTQLTQAIKFIEHTDKDRWVFKAEGAVATNTTHVTDNRDHLLQILHTDGLKADSFILQERVDGVEISTEGWYDYRVGWLPPFNSTFERKRLMPGDVGPMTGAMGSIVFYWDMEEPRLVKEVLLGIEPYLRQIRYVGPLDVNAIVTSDGVPHFLEFTPRLGWDAFCAFMAGYSGSVGDFIVALGKGQAREMSFATTFMGAVRVSIPAKGNEGAPLLAPWKQAPRNFMLGAVWHDGKVLRSSGVDSDAGLTTVFEVGSIGDSIEEVRTNIYKKFIPRIFVPDITYRDDIGIQAMQDVMRLADMGYEVPLVLGAPMMLMQSLPMGAPPTRGVRG